MPAVSDGTVVPANQSISPEEAAARTDAFFRPYHDAIAACLDRAMGFGAVPILVAVHSFTPVFDGFARPWEVGLLYEHDDQLVQPLKEALAALRPGLTIGGTTRPTPSSARPTIRFRCMARGAACPISRSSCART